MALLPAARSALPSCLAMLRPPLPGDKQGSARMPGYSAASWESSAAAMNFSACSAAMQPVPAAVTACR